MKKRRKIQMQILKTKSAAKQGKMRETLVKIEIGLQRSHAATHSYREEKAISAIKKNSKYFFSYAKKFAKTNKPIGPLLNRNQEYTASSKEMADLLSDQYGSVFSIPTKQSAYRDVVTDENQPTLENFFINEADIIDAIDKLSCSSASGPDGVPAVLLKKCKSTLSNPLVSLYKCCIEQGITPALLKQSHIVPIFKSGHQGLAVNYRPISLTSHIVKILEKVVRNQISRFLESNKLYNPHQHGFRQGHSCLSQLLEHYDQIIEYLQQGLNVDTIYLDFSKAFNKVDHGILLDKLEIIGIKGKIKDWIASFLTDRYQRVTVNGFLSDPMHVKSGVPQGSVIGPLLFLILISDIDHNIVSHTSSFADDTRLMKSI